MATDLLSYVTLIPSIVWAVLIVTMLFSMVPSPLQPLLMSFFSRGKNLVSSSPSKTPNFLMVPQKLFLHFYIIGTVFNGFIFILMLLYTFLKPNLLPGFKMGDHEKWGSLFLLFLFELQVSRRLYENLYVSKFSPGAKMHLVAYLLGLIYYFLVPLSFFPRSKELLLELVQGHINLRADINEYEISIQGWESFLKIGWLYWLGAAVFIWGSLHQHRCHVILASLRSNADESKKGGHTYKIPYGDWFEYASSAHYFAEIVIYSAFVIATGGRNLDVWLMFAFVVLNLSIAAVETHEWYKTKFENYPTSRKAIIPFIL